MVVIQIIVCQELCIHSPAHHQSDQYTIPTFSKISCQIRMASTRRHHRTPKKDLFLPHKYYAGLTRKQKLERRAEIQKYGAKHWKDPKAYIGFKTDTFSKTKKKSSYTEQWNRLFPEAKSLEERSKVTGVPVKFLKTVYNRGMAAWRTGHRPGMSEQAWSYPRVSSYLLCGKTHYSTDSDQVRAAKKESASARKWFERCKISKLTTLVV